MENSWVSIKRRFLSPAGNVEGHQDQKGEERHPESGPAAVPSSGREISCAPQESEGVAAGDMLDAAGRQSETIRVGIEQVRERLEEIARIKEDLETLVLEPVDALISDYPLVQAKLLRAEDVVKREQEQAAAVRRELRDLTVAHEKLADEFTVISSQHQHASRALRDQEAQVESLTAALREQEARAGDLDRQLAAERERARVVSDELQSVRKDAQASDAAVGRLERDLAEARETLEILEFDNQSLRSASGEQTQRLAALDVRYIEVEQQLNAAQERIGELQSRLEAEHGLRKKLEAQLDAERTGARVEISALEMKLEGITSRMGVTEKILSHAREQLREKTDELKAAERVVKEALLDKSTLEHRLDAAQQDLERQTALAAESQQARSELSERCEMLTKAIAAKESLLQRADHRTGMLLDRIDQLTRKFEEERSALETKNKRLWEDLQREKSERALAQGALETARRSRSELEREFAKLQRQRRRGGADAESATETAPAPDVAAENREPPTNVMAFKGADAEESRPASPSVP
jgi:crescentin